MVTLCGRKAPGRPAGQDALGVLSPGCPSASWLRLALQADQQLLPHSREGHSWGSPSGPLHVGAGRPASFDRQRRGPQKAAFRTRPRSAETQLSAWE